ncbi:MAG TPA: hypothetical protein VJI96_02325 [Candidatus Andersenbacteria bacterium]|nr:hypothetical protein [Candidatus Andersenbacteria bacterium]
MKYEINLLPPSALVERQGIIIKRRERLMFSAVMLSCGIILMSYGAVFARLTFTQDSVADQIDWQNKDRDTIEEQIKKLNRDIVSLDVRVSSYAAWTTRIPDVVVSAPNRIKISRIELIESPETLVITGTALEGSDVIAYQEALEKLPWVDHVVAPLQNFARSPESTIVFTVFHKKASVL